jgi:UDP-glucose 4-epimerase
MAKNILITGASGFIGSFLVEEALAQGFTVYAATRHTSNLQYLKDSRIKLITLNLSDAEGLKQQFVQLSKERILFDYVVHNAGITYAKKKEDFYRNNYHCTRNLADALWQSRMPLKKFVLISSLASYGPGNSLTGEPIRTSHSKNPITVYGKSKRMAECYTSCQAHLPYLIINPTAVYGPRDKDFFQFIKLICKGWEPYIGRNKQMISMIYVKDLAKAIISLAQSAEVNRSYIVSDGNGYCKEELGQFAKELLNRKTIKLKLPLRAVKAAIATTEQLHVLFTGSMPFLNLEKVDEISQPNWLCDSEETWVAVNEQPKYDLKEGLRETILWYKENKWL